MPHAQVAHHVMGVLRSTLDLNRDDRRRHNGFNLLFPEVGSPCRCFADNIGFSDNSHDIALPFHEQRTDPLIPHPSRRLLNRRIMPNCF